ncbi:methionine--tRNA ligase [Silvibacterium acidisoli]|uniref:methionine--tRNA ligase n=1 Tax=Acidobacteriaceae bacterium ZG23-2 TaxID=2883246 RepID=UPI00406C5061
MPDKFYLTTPIYYVNARPHIGTAYTTIAADAIARRKRSLGVDTFFLTGTDEHGQKIERSAAAAGITPQAFTDSVSSRFRELWDRMGLTYDYFVRTTDANHKRGAQKLFAELHKRGYIYLSTYTGQYCVSEETFVEGPPGTIGPDGKPTETVTEENFYFKLSEFQRPVIDLIESNQLVIESEARRNEVLSFLRGDVANAEKTEMSTNGLPYVPGALKDLSVSRSSFDWGIPVPEPAASETKQKHIIYVWLDALTNYLTAVGYGSDAPEDQARFAKYWPADLHLVGKEITRFHCVYWPAFLLAAGLPLPKKVVAHGWLLFEESKMSKSRGNIVRAETILDVLGADALRYFLLREIVFGQDGSFSFDALVKRYNSDLANGYGNLVSRTLAMIQRYFDGVLPEPAAQQADGLATESHRIITDFARFFDNFEFSRALEAAWTLVAATDGYLTASAPWKQSESTSDEQQKALRATVLSTAAEAIRIVTALIYPVIPDAAAKVWAQLGLGDIKEADLKNLTWGGLKPGTKLGELGPVFPRAEKDAITRMQELEQNNNAPAEAKPAADETAPVTGTPAVPAPPETGTHSVPAGPSIPATDSAQITIDDFAKVDLRVAQIKVAERVPKADKLLRLEVDLGYEQRQILAGIAEAYAPESLIGRKVVIVANLAPRKLRGLESNGMIVAASLEGGKAVLASFIEDIELGARLK